MEKQFKLEGESLAFLCDGKTVFQIRLDELLGFSDSFPWQLRNIKIDHASCDGESAAVSGTDEEKKVRAQADIRKKNGKIRLCVTFENIAGEILQNAVMQVGLRLHNVENENVTIPHNIYNDNPSADPKRLVPHIGKDGGLIVEEHRLPIPAVNVEWEQEGAVRFATLFSIPEPKDCEDDKYWSLGAVKTPDGICVQSLSGQTMFNGMKDMVYAGKNAPVPFERGYKMLMPNQIYKKEYCIDFGCPIQRGRGFMNLIDAGYEIFKPHNAPKLGLEQVIALKTNCLDSRYFANERAAGYLTFGSANSFGNKSGRPDYFLYGWTGQAIKLAWCDIKLGIEKNEPERISRALKTVDFYAANGESKQVCGLREGYYLVAENRFNGAGWDDREHFSSRIQGEAVCDLLEVMLLLRQMDYAVPVYWEDAVKRACAFMMDASRLTTAGLYPMLWDTKGVPTDDEINSAGISCVAALARAYEYFGDKACLQYAQQMLKRYYDRQMAEFQYPFCRATMDARCEDKEAGIFFFLAALELFKITKDEKYKEWTVIAGKWLLTFVYFWQTGFKKGGCCEQKGFSTVGWPGVSVQNHHLDVFFPCYEMYEFGRLTGISLFQDMGKLVFRAFSNGICTQKGEWGFDVPGEQTEQFYQTNFFMSTYPGLLSWVQEWRKGIRIWNPSWIIAQVLKSGIQFDEDAKMRSGKGEADAEK